MRKQFWRQWIMAALVGFLPASGVTAAEENKASVKIVKSIADAGLAEADATKEAVAEMTKKFQAARESYHGSLKSIRAAAVGKSDIEEVARIDKALEGECITGYSTSQAQAVYKTFNSRLVEANKIFVGKLQSVIKRLLTDGETDDAAYVKTVIDSLSVYLPESRKDRSASGKKTFKIAADKDWQKTGVTLKKNSEVKVSANGTWAPGRRTGPRVRRPGGGVDVADADTFPLQLRIGEKQEEKGGKKWEFITEAEGEVEARMSPPALDLRVLSEARGSMTVLLQWEPGELRDDAETLEQVLSRIIANEKNGKSAAGGAVKKITVSALDNWKNSHIKVREGQQVVIKAEGLWTRNRSNKSLKPANADVFRYQVKIGDEPPFFGGTVYSFVCKKSGELFFRPSFADAAVSRNLTPEGKLDLEVTVSD